MNLGSGQPQKMQLALNPEREKGTVHAAKNKCKQLQQRGIPLILCLGLRQPARQTEQQIVVIALYVARQLWNLMLLKLDILSKMQLVLNRKLALYAE